VGSKNGSTKGRYRAEDVSKKQGKRGGEEDEGDWKVWGLKMGCPVEEVGGSGGVWLQGEVGVGGWGRGGWW